MLATLLLAVPLVSAAPKLQAKVVDADGKPVADAVVFVYEEAPAKGLKAPDKPAEMDQVDKEFMPHVLPVVAGTKVRFPNKDDVHHHLYSFSPAKTFEIELYKGEPAAPIVFDKPGVVKIGCNIHDWMSGSILVLANAHFAKTDGDGAAELAWPAGKGELEIAVWHERLKGGVDGTRRKLKPGKDGPVQADWTLELKPERKKARRPAEYP